MIYKKKKEGVKMKLERSDGLDGRCSAFHTGVLIFSGIKSGEKKNEILETTTGDWLKITLTDGSELTAIFLGFDSENYSIVVSIGKPDPSMIGGWNYCGGGSSGISLKDMSGVEVIRRDYQADEEPYLRIFERAKQKAMKSDGVEVELKKLYDGKCQAVYIETLIFFGTEKVRPKSLFGIDHETIEVMSGDYLKITLTNGSEFTGIFVRFDYDMIDVRSENFRIVVAPGKPNSSILEGWEYDGDSKTIFFKDMSEIEVIGNRDRIPEPYLRIFEREKQEAMKSDKKS